MATQPPIPAGYSVRSLDLGLPYGGALAVDPTNPDRVYVATGSFGDMDVISVNTVAGTTTTVAGPFGNIGGMTALPNGDLLISENFTSETIFLAHDANLDGDFFDAGELAPLIPPLLRYGDYTGAQMAVAPAGNAAGIPAGVPLVQTADGAASSSLLVIDTTTSPAALRPAGGAFFTGFEYNGGVAFDPDGNVILGESRFTWVPYALSGRIFALVNTNGNEAIDAGESHALVDEPQLPLGLADLTVSKERTVYFGDNSGVVKSFPLPGNLLMGSGSPVPFIGTNSIYVSTVRIDDVSKPFTSGATGNTARLYIGGLDSSYAGFTNLLILEPTAPARVQDWQLYHY